MTLRDAYEAVLVLLKKEEAPAMLLSDFNMYYNKATMQYINERYNVYDVNMQTTDDLSVLSISSFTLPKIRDLFYLLPSNYLHLLRCELELNIKKEKCNTQYKKYKNVRRLTAEMASGIEDNYYFKPSLKNPYYYLTGDYITNVNTNYQLEIRIGDLGNNEISNLKIDYLRKPTPMIISWSQIKESFDTSQVLEFPDYVNNEIINRCVYLLLEKGSDPRLQTAIPVTSTIPVSPIQTNSK